MATWSTLIALLSIHLATNYAAVTAVSMRSLNRQRANIVLSHMMQHGRVLGPTEVSQRERVFERDGVLRWPAVDDQILGYARIGVTLDSLLTRIGGLRHGRTGAREMQDIKLSELMHIYNDEDYILWYKDFEAVIVLKQGCTPMNQIKAWAQALLLARRARVGAAERKPTADAFVSSDGQIAELKYALDATRNTFAEHTGKLRDAGWDLQTAALETRTGARVVIGSEK